ncbi:hypothetical protein BX600DRAFT_27047 [Xylariales sp. PMI_506]|nr:hypothetical protein BX600DRAFT_27047 [Xylariales sp. PMI_506]
MNTPYLQKPMAVLTASLPSQRSPPSSAKRILLSGLHLVLRKFSDVPWDFLRVSMICKPPDLEGNHIRLQPPPRLIWIEGLRRFLLMVHGASGNGPPPLNYTDDSSTVKEGLWVIRSSCCFSGCCRCVQSNFRIWGPATSPHTLTIPYKKKKVSTKHQETLHSFSAHGRSNYIFAEFQRAYYPEYLQHNFFGHSVAAIWIDIVALSPLRVHRGPRVYRELRDRSTRRHRRRRLNLTADDACS